MFLDLLCKWRQVISTNVPYIFSDGSINFSYENKWKNCITYEYHVHIITISFDFLKVVCKQIMFEVVPSM